MSLYILFFSKKKKGNPLLYNNTRGTWTTWCGWSSWSKICWRTWPNNALISRRR